MSERELSPLELLLTGRAPAPDAAPHNPLEEPAPPPAEEPRPRRPKAAAKVKEVHERILNRDHRLNGKTQRELEVSLGLDWDDISAIFAEYPEVMRFNTATRLWGIHPDAEV